MDMLVLLLTARQQDNVRCVQLTIQLQTRGYLWGMTSSMRGRLSDVPSYGLLFALLSEVLSDGGIGAHRDYLSMRIRQHAQWTLLTLAKRTELAGSLVPAVNGCMGIAITTTF